MKMCWEFVATIFDIFAMERPTKATHSVLNE